MSGYCATGSVTRAMPPPSVTKMDSTAAKIGRSMKKRENTAVKPHFDRMRSGSSSGASSRPSGGAWPLPLPAAPFPFTWTTLTGVGGACPLEGAAGRAAARLLHNRPISDARRPQQPPRAAPGVRADEPEHRLFRRAFDDVEEHRRQEDAEQRHAQHPAEDGQAQRPPHLRPGADRDHQRHDAEDERERGHQDRPQTQLHRRQRGVAARQPRLALVLGEFDNQDRVLAGQADQHHEADLREDVDVRMRGGQAEPVAPASPSG